jgi:hypothetical protein
MTTLVREKSPLKPFPEPQELQVAPKPSKYHQIFQEQRAKGRWGYIPEQRQAAVVDKVNTLKDKLKSRIISSYMLVDGFQKDDEQFQQTFQSCFAHFGRSRIHPFYRAAGEDMVVHEAAHSLVKSFGGFSDVCFTYEEELHEPIYYSGSGDYGSGGRTVTHTTCKKPHENLIEELKNILEERHGMQKELLSVLKQEGKKIAPFAKPEERDCLLQEIPEGWTKTIVSSIPAFKMFSWIFPKCADYFKEICSRLLEIEWLEKDIHDLEIYLGKKPPSSRAFPVDVFSFEEEPIDGEYRYSGEEDVREVFARKLEDNIKHRRIRHHLRDILKGYLIAMEDGSSKLLFEGPTGSTFKTGYRQAEAQFNQTLLRVKQQETDLWLLQTRYSPIQEKLIEEARESSLCKGKKPSELLVIIEEYPTLLLSLIDADPKAFLKRSAPQLMPAIQRVRYQREQLVRYGDLAKDHFVLEQLFPHYLDVIKHPDFYFNTQELALAALLFEKKMQVVTPFQDSIIPAIALVNRDLPSETTVIHHEGVHFSRCLPFTAEDLDHFQESKRSQIYKDAKALAAYERQKQTEAAAKRWNDLKDDLCGTVWSGALSLGTGNPSYVMGQAARMGINRFANQLDPYGQNKELQVLKLVANAGAAGVLGGNPWDIKMGVVVDALDLLSRSQKTGKGESSARHLLGALVKGGLAKDKKKLAAQLLGGLIAEAAGQLPQTDEMTDIDYRLARAFFTNSDFQNYWVNERIEELFKEPPKAKTGGVLSEEEQAKYPKQVITENPDEIKQKIRKIVEQLEDLDEVIAIGAQHVKNLEEQSLNTEEATQALKVATGKRPEMLEGLKESCQRLQQVDPTIDLESVIVPKQPHYNPPSAEPSMVDQKHRQLLDLKQMFINQRDQKIAELNNPNYSEFGTPQDTLIQKGAGVTTANDKVEEKEKKYDKANRYWKPSKKVRDSLKNAKENRKTATREEQSVKDFISGTQESISGLDKKIETVEKLLEASRSSSEQAGKVFSDPQFTKKKALGLGILDSGSVWVPPEASVPLVMDQKSKKGNHHLGYVKDGVDQSLGKYTTAEDARFISGQSSNLMSHNSGFEWECFGMQQQLFQQGVPVSEIPNRPDFEFPTLKGNDSSKNNDLITRTLHQNRVLKESFVSQAKQVAERFKVPVHHQRFSKGEIKELAQAMQPRIKDDPKEHGLGYKVWRVPGKALRWLDDHGVQLSVNVNVERPLYQTKTPTGSSYSATRHELAVQRPAAIEASPNPSSLPSYNWAAIQDHQNQQIFDMNMAFKSPPQPLGIDYSSLQDLGMQLPPTTTAQALQSGTREPLTAGVSKLPLQMAGVLPFAISKAVPEETQNKVATWIKDYIQQWKDDPIKAKKDLDVCLILGAKKAIVIAVQAFEQPSLKAKANTLTLMDVSDRCDHFVAQKLDIDLGSPNAQVGMFIGELAMPLPLVVKAKPVMKVGHEALAFMRHSSRFFKPLSMRTSVVNPRMMMTRPMLIQEAIAKHMGPQRAFAFPQGFPKEIRAIEALKKPVCRSGFVGERTVQQAAKAVNMPSWRKIKIDIEHILSGHKQGGWRTGCKGNNKSLFPEGMADQQIEKAIRQAYRNGEKFKTRGNQIGVKGSYNDMNMEIWVDINTKEIKSAWPIK